MNWKRGLRRVTWIVSVFTGVLFLIVAIRQDYQWLHTFFNFIFPDNLPQLIVASASVLIVFLIGFLPVWIIYLIYIAVCWAMKGFRD